MNRKNVDALKNILQGKPVEKNISVGYTPEKKSLGDEYEQKNGYKVKKTRFDDIRVPMFCPNCEKVMKAAKDTQAYYSNGTCLNCMVDYHDQLRREGKLEQFAFKKRILSASSWLSERQKELEEFEKSVDRDKNVQDDYVHSDGNVEKWTSDVKFGELIDNYKQYLSEFQTELQQSITKYEKEYNEHLGI